MSWIAAAMFVAGLAVIAGFYMEQNTRITDIDFTGNTFTDEQNLLSVIDPVSPVGELADSVNYHVLFRTLQSLPYVENVNVSMNFSGRLTFRIFEHEPMGLLVDGSKRSYVGKGGLILPLIQGKATDVPLVYGFSVISAGDSLKSDSWNRMEQFLSEAKNNRIGWVTLSEIAWNSREGVVALSHENGVKLIFGHENYRERISHWELFYTGVVAKEGIQAFRQIDLRFRNQIVTQQS